MEGDLGAVANFNHQFWIVEASSSVGSTPAVDEKNEFIL
jgi:hypothetical protein